MDCGDAENFVEAGGAQPRGVGSPAQFGERIWIDARYTAGPIQSRGIKHRRAAGDPVGEKIAAGIRRTAHRLLPRTGPGQLHRIGEVDRHL